MSVQPTLQNNTSRNSTSPINSIHKLLYTALALVVFCGTAWSLYWKGVTRVYGPAEGTLPILTTLILPHFRGHGFKRISI